MTIFSQFEARPDNYNKTGKKKKSPPPASPLTQPLFPFPLPCYILQMKPQGNYWN
jgi:hypothetical protein